MLKIWTAQYRYPGADRFDITAKGKANLAFAPTWDLVKRYKAGEISDTRYTLEYTEQMRQSFCNNTEAWKALLRMEEVTFVCFCAAGSFCHRKVLAEILDFHYSEHAKYMGERNF